MSGLIRFAIAMVIIYGAFWFGIWRMCRNLERRRAAAAPPSRQLDSDYPRPRRIFLSW